MKPYFDIYHNEIKDGDTIRMPHVKEPGCAVDDKGYYTSKVHYNPLRDRLEDDQNLGFRLAYGVEKVFTAMESAPC